MARGWCGGGSRVLAAGMVLVGATNGLHLGADGAPVALVAVGGGGRVAAAEPDHGGARSETAAGRDGRPGRAGAGERGTSKDLYRRCGVPAYMLGCEGRGGAGWAPAGQSPGRDWRGAAEIRRGVHAGRCTQRTGWRCSAGRLGHAGPRRAARPPCGRGRRCWRGWGGGCWARLGLSARAPPSSSGGGSLHRC